MEVSYKPVEDSYHFPISVQTINPKGIFCIRNNFVAGVSVLLRASVSVYVWAKFHKFCKLAAKPQHTSVVRHWATTGQRRKRFSAAGADVLYIPQYNLRSFITVSFSRQLKWQFSLIRVCGQWTGELFRMAVLKHKESIHSGQFMVSNFEADDNEAEFITWDVSFRGVSEWKDEGFVFWLVSC